MQTTIKILTRLDYWTIHTSYIEIDGETITVHGMKETADMTHRPGDIGETEIIIDRRANPVVLPDGAAYASRER